MSLDQQHPLVLFSARVCLYVMCVCVGVSEWVSPTPAVMYGEVKSPLYPQPYPAGVYEEWNLIVPTGYRIQLTFTHLDIEPSENCSTDSLTVTFNKMILGYFCGQFRGYQAIFSQGNHLKIVLNSSRINVGLHQGFMAYYTAIMVECEEPKLPFPLAVEGRLSTHYKSQIKFTCYSKYYKLDNDEVFTCEAEGHWKSKSGQTKLPRCHPICGLTESQNSRGRILGGQRAKLGQIPWQLLIKYPSRGGASLINDRWAVTTAHVVDGHETKTLAFYGGMVDSMDSKAVAMLTEKIIIHPGYEKGTSDSQRTSYDNDIALLKMSSRVKLGPNLMPICLPEKAEGDALEGKVGTVSGYGMTDKTNVARMLHYADIQEYGKETCNDTPNIMEGNRLNFTENMFCAGLEGVDSCGGDGGSPLFVPMMGWGKADEPYRLKGIVSWGDYCRSLNYKGYYTKVQNYLGWIKETLEKEDDD